MFLWQMSHNLVERWRMWTKEEYIPVREEMLDFAIDVIVRTVFGLQTDEQLLKRIRVSYDAVRSLALAGFMRS